MVRTILTWRILGEDLVGTCHVPTPGRAGGLSGAPSVGILLLNPGSAMRSGNSDLSVRIGDRLALRGFPVFRFDLSGLGDSSGSIPADVEAYWSEVLNGRNDEATVALIERIQLEFGVARVIVGGLCAAALPAVRAVSSSSAAPAGLILLEPNFRMDVQNQRKEARPAVGLYRGSRIAGATRSLRTFVQGVVKRPFAPSLPRDANVPLIAHWHESLVHGVRSLVVVAVGQRADRYVTRILETMPTRAPGLVACVRVPGTNHLFTSGAGRDAVLTALERWVMEGFGSSAEPVARQTSGR